MTLNIIATASNSAFKADEPVDLIADESRHQSGVPERPPSLKPLELGESSLLGRFSYHGRQKSFQDHNKRPSISAPYSFRRLDYYDAQKQSLVPLRLGPVVLRESAIPPEMTTPAPPTGAVYTHVHQRSDSTQNLLDGETRFQSYWAKRESPFQRCQQRTSMTWPFPSQPSTEETDSRGAPVEQPAPTRPPISTRSSSSSLRRHNGENSAFPITPRSSSERLHTKRKRSQPSLRKHYAESGDMEIDKEILELNTIVEERKAETARENSPNQHVPAIAPSMQVRARSETLDAICSALSRPYSARDFHQAELDAGCTNMDIPVRPRLRRSNSTTSWASSRVSGWLSGIFTPSQVRGDEPFYKCQPPPGPLQRSHSEASICTLITEVDSPSLTAASSPTSKGHSRNHTGESRVTPLSPATPYGGLHYYTDSRELKVAEEQWPVVMTPTSQVGIAL